MNPSLFIIYDDDRPGLRPVTALRAAFEVRTGAAATADRIRRALPGVDPVLWVAPRLAHVVAERHPDASVNPDTLHGGSALLINGRWLGLHHAQQVRALSLHQALVQTDGQVIAVHLPAQTAHAFLRSACATLPDHVSTVRLQHRVLIEKPWHILDALAENLLADLGANNQPTFSPDRYPGVTVCGGHPVRVATGARLTPSVVIDATQGPVVIEADAEVQPLAALQGPCFVGRGTTISAHAHIRPHTAIGPCCKVGGEVSASLFQAYSNKAHAGYLGDSLVGEWVNLGAGTNASNLKNTYGPVRMRLREDEGEQDTGRMFLGCVLGDFVRTAIGTRLPTGAVIHTGCMIACTGWAPKCAMPLGFYDDSGRREYDFQKFCQTIHRMTDRRGVRFTRHAMDLIQSLSDGADQEPTRRFA